MANPLTSLSVKLLIGDAKVLIACNMDQKDSVNLAGFTIQCQPPQELAPYYLLNELQFADPSVHAQVATEPANSMLNAPIQKFRWLHVPGLTHQVNKVAYGQYTYTVTPRYFQNKVLLPINRDLSVTAQTQLNPFTKGNIDLGFTRGFTQSQAFTRHFGPKATFKPNKAPLLFDTGVVAGVSNSGDKYTYEDEYTWSGFTAKTRIFDLVNEVINDKSLFLDMCAYDLNEPDILRSLLQLAKEGRIRLLLDNAALHHDTKKPTAEDKFEVEFNKADSKPNGVRSMIRGDFDRFQHHKLLIVSKGPGRAPVKVLSGSTNFSVTGMYANSNHVIVFNDKGVAGLYQQMFQSIWTGQLAVKPFLLTDFPKKEFPFTMSGSNMSITFAPHDEVHAVANLDKITARVAAEKSSVLFAVMGTDAKTSGSVAPALIKLHERTDIFSAGITDSKNTITFYKPSSTTGIRVTGLPGQTILPPPFAEESPIDIGHQVHHKFIVCGFNTPDAVVWLGSSNLAKLGEMQNGDNLIEIHDRDIATVFALEALALVDHFHFRDSHPAPPKPKDKTTPVPAPKKLLAFNLSTDGKWAASYFQPGDLHKTDRELFAK